MNYNTTFKILFGTIVSIILFSNSFIYSVNADERKDEDIIIIEEVYAYSRPLVLLEKIDKLLEKQMAIGLAVMPVYENTEYPAMIEFTEVIKYAQSRGVRVLLHFPIIQKSDVTTEEVISIIESQIELYNSFGIYPRGILVGVNDLSYNWMFGEIENILPIYTLDENTIEYYDNSLNESFPIITTNSLNEIFYSYTPTEAPENFDFKRGLLEDVRVSLEPQNKILIGVVFVWLIVFGVMIIFARRRNKKDFLRKGDDN